MPIERFKQAQADPRSGFASALLEIQQGHKRSHWIWYVFPQIAGLGRSSMARKFALVDLDEAREYLRDDTLRKNLTAITEAVASQLDQQIPIRRLMGSEIDSLKLVSSLTLFQIAVEREVARNADNPDHPDLLRLAHLIPDSLGKAEVQGLPRCLFTLAAVRGG